MTAKPTVYLNPDPSTPGHVFARTADAKRVDTFGGPLDFVSRYYASLGYRVIGENGETLHN